MCKNTKNILPFFVIDVSLDKKKKLIYSTHGYQEVESDTW